VQNKDSYEDPFRKPDARIGNACSVLREKNKDITIRAIATILGIAHTTVSRNKARRLQVERCADLQESARSISKQTAKISKHKSGLEAARLKERIKELESQVGLLTASHKAMIFAVGELGGLEGWMRFFERYQSVLDDLPKAKNVENIR